MPELTITEKLLTVAVTQLKQQVQERDQKIIELQGRLTSANNRLKAAGFVNDIDGNRFEE